MSLIRNQQFYSAKLVRSLTLGGSETEIYVDELPTETTGSLFINPRSEAIREKITYTGTATSPNRLTGVTRGLPFATATGSPTSTVRVAANCKRHSAGESIEMNPGHYEALMADKINGLSPWDSDLDMGGFKVTNVGAPTNPNDAASKAYADSIAVAGAPNASTTVQGLVEMATSAEANAGTAVGGTGAFLVDTPAGIARVIQDAKYVYGADSSGTDAYAVTLVPAPTAYATGQTFVIRFNTANTGSATLNINGLGAKTIKKLRDQDLEPGDLEALSFGILSYDGTNFQLHTVQATMPTTALLTEMATFFAGTAFSASDANTLIGGGLSTQHFHNAQQFTINTRDTTNNSAYNATVTNPRHSQTTSTPDGMNVYAAQFINSQVVVERFSRDTVSGLLTPVNSVTLSTDWSASLASQGGGIVAGATYVYVCGLNSANSDINIRRLALDLTGETNITISGTANTSSGFAAGNDSVLYVSALTTSQVTAVYTVSGTTATRGTDFNINVQSQYRRGFFFDGTNLFVRDANTNGAPIKRYNTNGTLGATGTTYTLRSPATSLAASSFSGFPTGFAAMPGDTSSLYVLDVECLSEAGTTSADFWRLRGNLADKP